MTAQLKLRPPRKGTAEWQMYNQFASVLSSNLDKSNYQYDPSNKDLIKKSQSNLINFTQYTYHNYLAEPAHKLIAGKLMDVLQGKIKRLMIFAPPQHGKSELVSVRFPAFWFAHRPDDPIIFTSYGATHAVSKAADARELIDSAPYSMLFPDIKVSKKTRGKASWRIAGHRGKYEAVGMGGPITGHGAMLGIIDDPIKNWAEAQSETIRESQWHWYRSTFRTRIWENGAIIIIMTRWHEDDLAGKLLKTDGGEWEVLRLPALAESQFERRKSHEFLNISVDPTNDPLGRKENEPLCPIRFSYKELKQIKNDVGSLAWFAEYQATPRAPEGNWLKRAWFKLSHMAPHPTTAMFVRYWDKAGSEGEGKYTSGVLMCYEQTYHRYTILDLVRGRWSSLKREEIIKATAVNDRKNYGYRVSTWVEQEPGSGGKDQAAVTIRNLRGFDIRADKVRLKKEVRLNPGAYGFQAQAEAGNIYILQAPWNEEALDEYTTIPNTSYWDITDATVGAFNKLNDRARTWDAVQGLGVLDDFKSVWE